MQGLRDTDYALIESDNVGRSYHVYVMLPQTYGLEPDRHYRTIYLLDGGSLLPLLGGYYRYLRFADETEEAIFVAISYGDISFAGGNYRSTDFTAPSAERDYWGGASKFQAFLADELMPWVEARYRAAPDKRIIFGHSLGGQFVLYTAQTRPNLFYGHIASNPALHRNLDFYLEQVPDGPSASLLFIGTGSRDAEMFREPLQRWIDHWTAIDDKPWQLEIRELVDHTHTSAPPAAFWRGLSWIDALDE
ncbi:MAG: alpha/beta hydrolase-fold protein [Pseudomonadota bacterium]